MATNKQGFAERLLEARMRYGIGRGRVVTQSELARAVGVSPQAWSSWEAGGAEPGLEMLQKIAATLGIEPGLLAFGLERPRMVAEPEAAYVPTIKKLKDRKTSPNEEDAPVTRKKKRG